MKKIFLTQNQHTLVDDVDFDSLFRFNWYAKWDKKTASFYVGRNVRKENGKWSSITIHRQILGLAPRDGIQVDHKNHDTLDNRRENLRLVSNTQNQYNQKVSKANTSGHKGVSWSKRNRKWASHIRKDKRLIHLGYFSELKEAADAYDKAAHRLFGKYSLLNKSG